MINESFEILYDEKDGFYARRFFDGQLSKLYTSERALRRDHDTDSDFWGDKARNAEDQRLIWENYHRS